MNVDIIKRIMSEKKIKLTYFRNQETEKIDELLTHISTINISELNELNSEGAKLVSEKSVQPERTRTEIQNLAGK